MTSSYGRHTPAARSRAGPAVQASQYRRHEPQAWRQRPAQQQHQQSRWARRNPLEDYAWVERWRLEKKERQAWSAEKWKARFLGLSKNMSRTLRHSAKDDGLTLRKDGFIPVRCLLSHRHYEMYTEEEIRTSATPGHNSKERFELREEGGEFLVRARQGHSRRVGDVDQRALTTKITLQNAPEIALVAGGNVHSVFL